ncbi:MAG: hypothetical protein FI695_04890 [SAR202 cluster bacterium]|mgnify:FL=1|nr:hypothetical protein [Chloroflexota bacterium]MQG51298.1 hypothetical protein [SAR202 cluster bacterium]|tara:strand:- start:1259 stop:1450 length:192 start_codon:yes stop_codon:yes gene_type:complete
MKPKFFDGCKVKIQNFDRGYDGRIGILQAFGPKTNKEWKVVFEWPLGGLAGHVIVPEDNLLVL